MVLVVIQLTNKIYLNNKKALLIREPFLLKAKLFYLYFPIQNLENIISRTVSELISYVILSHI
ncbi:MAG: hypothetical protein ACD_73C00792G0005 [uncultured bacterium]|nr:MAG: hypothetical protein ACD_73C00792G0005 [uncultured bacterium]